MANTLAAYPFRNDCITQESLEDYTQNMIDLRYRSKHTDTNNTTLGNIVRSDPMKAPPRILTS